MGNTYEFDYDVWSVPEYSTATPLKKYIETLKGQLIGQTIQSIHTMGTIFNNYDNESFEEWEPEYNGLDLDEPIVIKTDNLQLEVWFYTDSRIKIGMNTMTMTEKSYQHSPWRDCSVFFNHSVGQMIVDIVVKTDNRGFYDSLGLGDRADGGDYFYEVLLVLDNNYGIRFIGQHEYMWVAEAELISKDFIPTDYRVYDEVGAKKSKHTDFIRFVPVTGNLRQYHDAWWVLEDNCSILICAIIKVRRSFDTYGNTLIDKTTWNRILDEWKFFCYAQTFDEVFEIWSCLDIKTHEKKDTIMFQLLNREGKSIWQKQPAEKHLYLNFAEWSRRIFKTSTHIEVVGL